MSLVTRTKIPAIADGAMDGKVVDVRAVVEKDGVLVNGVVMDGVVDQSSNSAGLKLTGIS